MGACASTELAKGPIELTASPEIPARVLQFLAERIDTVPQLEALLLLWESPQRQWTEEELAARSLRGPAGRGDDPAGAAAAAARDARPDSAPAIGTTRNGIRAAK